MEKINLYKELISFYKGKNILLTGHTGFKGTWLIKILNKFGANVYGFSLPKNNMNRFYSSVNKNLLIDFEGDITNLESLNSFSQKINPEIVINMAAQALVLESYRNPINTFETNIMGTVNLLSILPKFTRLKVALFVTTDKVYKNDNIKRNFIESDPLGGYDPYSASKAASEIIIESWRRTMNSKKIQILSARAGNVIGGGDWSENRLIPDIFKTILNNEKKVQIRNPESTRPWQHVIEPLIGYLLFIMYSYKNPQNEIFSLNFGPNLSEIKTVFEVIKEISIYLNKNIEDIVEIKPSYHYESKFLALDNSLAKEHIGWEPRFNFNETIKLTYDLYLNTSNQDINRIMEKQIQLYFM
jgi:CDP-glucose 4,6-dehydratase